MIALHGNFLVAGPAQGQVMALDAPLSFWGGIDPKTGLIIDHWHPNHGRNVSRTILMMPAGRGSSSSSAVLAEAMRLNTAPAAMILSSPDAILLVGALVGFELYAQSCPIVVVSHSDWQRCRLASYLAITTQGSSAHITG